MPTLKLYCLHCPTLNKVFLLLPLHCWRFLVLCCVLATVYFTPTLKDSFVDTFARASVTAKQLSEIWLTYIHSEYSFNTRRNEPKHNFMYIQWDTWYICLDVLCCLTSRKSKSWRWCISCWEWPWQPMSMELTQVVQLQHVMTTVSYWIWNAVRCRYNVVSFSEFITIDTP